ncbi:beta-amylase 1, chloroplastic-like [Juglans microcarpa x Juglans regia]|uniref:beta-amylase 1, chloroplastic-like n=1 Tax=Juglans microcarpa x Juglans regia TaxID=2249226 RepID=UPI001B7F6290|nr:beta-amylase 1, chloroplastic-like [Juglans microcarpa x Juglans regia]
MAIASPSTPSFSASFCCARSKSSPFSRFSSVSFAHRVIQPHPLAPRLAVSSRLNSSKPSGPGGSVSPDNGDLHQYELYHKFSPQRRRQGPPVFVTLPVDAVGPAGKLRRPKAMSQSFRALVAAGVEGVVMEVWWGLVEREEPRVYDWQGYFELVALARRSGLKVRAVMAFHECGTGPGDPYWIPLPLWVVEEIDKDPDLAYSDRFGRRNMEYISLGCDILPVLRGRSPIQAYTDFMRNFRETFRPFLGVIITGIQVGMGPAGELRYPSCPSQKLQWAWRSRELGEFQCYDKYMLASLNACARKIGMREWGNGGPIGAGNLMQNPEHTEFFRSGDGSWNTPYGNFFLEWYSGLLLLHGERICREAETIFRGTQVNTSAKVAGIHWHYGTQSHPSELTAGYYNTLNRDGYLQIARMLGRYGFSMCCTCFEMRDTEEKQMNPDSSPEGFLRQLLLAARVCDIPLEGENSAAGLDDDSFQQVLKMSKLYSNGLEKPSFSFNFMRMDKNMFEYQNWVRFTRFVRQMSDANIFGSKLGSGGDINLSSMLDATKDGLTFAYS